jgi:hypothetical protein
MEQHQQQASLMAAVDEGDVAATDKLATPVELAKVGGDALVAAAAAGHTSIVRLCVARGVHVDAVSVS